MQQLQVQRLGEKYQAQFACDSAQVSQPPAGGLYEYRVQGCDQVAFYSCLYLNSQNVCLLEHHRPLTDQERRELRKPEEEAKQVARAQELRREADSEFAAARQLIVAQPDKVQPLGQVQADDWRLEVSRLPNDVPFVLLHFATQRELSPAPCTPTLTRDGQVLTTETISAHPAHEADFLIRAADFQTLSTSQAIRGVVCGTDFTLDAPAREKLSAIVKPE